MKKLYYILMWVCLTTTSFAAEYRMVVPFAPGAQSDIAARQIATAFEKYSNDKIIVESIPGADGVVGVNHYKSNPDIEIIWLAASILSYNPAIKDNLPYKDSDFNHIIFVGTSPAIWITKPGSKIKYATDLLSVTPEFAGINSTVGELNVICINKEKKLNISQVPFKGAPDILVNTINGTVGVGIMSVTPSLIELAKANKVVILGSSYKNEITIDGITIPSVSKKLDVNQFNGFVTIAIKPGMDPVKAENLKRGLWLATQDADTKEKLKKLYILPDSTNDVKWIAGHIREANSKATLYMGNK